MASSERMELGLKRAYELAATGRYSDAAMVEWALENEAYREAAEWLSLPSIGEALTTICLTTRLAQRREAARRES